jgi:hypothetical protein
MKKLLYIFLFIPVFLQAQYTIDNPYNGVDMSNSYKANMHVHTTESDGLFDPDVLIGMYSTNDYQILSITDHDNYPTVDTVTTWPWTKWIDETPSSVWINSTDANDTTSAYYTDVDGNGHMLAVKGNEYTDQNQGTTINHVNGWFVENGYSDGPVGGEATYFTDVTSSGGLAQFNHPSLYSRSVSWYNNLIDTYDSIVGFEIRPYDYSGAQYKWDSINAQRSYNDLIWGIGNDDFHSSFPYTEYTRFYMDTLTEPALRTAMRNGQSTFSEEYSGGNGTWAPVLTGVTVSGNTITLTATDCDSVRWFDDASDSIETDLTTFSIDVSSYGGTTNFLRAELYNDDGITRTQPFGISSNGDIGGNYYVAVDGDDNDPGTFLQPFATWQKAFDTAGRNDTVYFRGGVYQPTVPASGNNITYLISTDTVTTTEMWADSGYIYFLAYPGETPILDCSLIDPSGRNFNTGLVISRIHFVHFKGLTIRNVYQLYDQVTAGAIGSSLGSNQIYENMTVHGNGGPAFTYQGRVGRYGITYDTTQFLNCDAYDNCDTMLVFGATPETAAYGGLADGWKIDNYEDSYTYWYGCRAWNNSDDGFNATGSGITYWQNCWAFQNGHPSDTIGEGNGWKCGAVRDVVIDTTLILKNTLSALNDGYAYALLDYPPYYRMRSNIFNNTSYGNLRGYVNSWGNTEPALDIFINNIMFADTTGMNMSADSSRNNNVTLEDSFPFYSENIPTSNNDFVSLDVEELKGSRQGGGSLPEVNFLNLSPTSDLVDAGYDVGLPYNGAAPDVGYKEYNPNDPTNPKISYYGVGSGGDVGLKNGKIGRIRK